MHPSILAAALSVLMLVAPPANAVDLHAPWSRLLERFVNDGSVDYRGLARERAALDAYLQSLERTSKSELAALAREDRLAFWINAYNAYTVALVLDHYPIDSIWDVTPWWKRPLGGPFAVDFIPLGHLVSGADVQMSLNDIEHGILRKQFTEPRIHFAIVCASKGCPRLARRAFEGNALDAQLDAVAREFLSDTAKNRFDAEANVLYVSPIFDWFAEDFAAGGGPAGWFWRYREGSRRDAPDTPKIRYTTYDWSLNEAAVTDNSPGPGGRS